MAKQRLTDRDDISGVTLTDLLHFVVTGDTSQNPAGSSFKGNVEQLFDAFSSYTCTNPLIVETVNACSSGITINGNVTINGSATTINTEVIQSKDNNIILNYSGTHLTALNGGITVEDGQSDGVDSVLYIDSDGCWHADPGFCDLTVDGIPFTGQTPYLFVENGTVNSITTRYSGNTITTSDYSNIGGGSGNIMLGAETSVIGGGFGNTMNNTYSAVIAGGYLNNINADGWINTISGGYDNRITDNTVGGFIGGGGLHRLSGDSDYSSVVGGKGNLIIGKYSSIVGGINNIIDDDSILGALGNSTIGGGRNNSTNSKATFIGGGGYNNIDAGPFDNGSQYSSIAGGYQNSLTSTQNFTNGSTFIGGGSQNNITNSKKSSILGGQGNKVDDNSDYSNISGGHNNAISGGTHSSVVGGEDNYISGGTNSFIGGGQNNNISDSSNSGWNSIQGGYANNITATPNSLFCNLIAGGGRNNLGDSKYSSIVGGRDNVLSGSNYSTIGGGKSNINSGDYSSVVGGKDNNIIIASIGVYTSKYSSIGGGYGNTLKGVSSSNIGGGYGNTIDAPGSEGAGWVNTIAGGFNNTIATPGGLGSYGFGNFIGNGSSNIISGSTYSNIIGGKTNIIDNIADSKYGTYSSIVGGKGNIVSGRKSSILGGNSNTINKDIKESSIGGGDGNTIYVDTTLGTVSPLDSRYSQNQHIMGNSNYIGGSIGPFANLDRRSSHSIILGGKDNSNYGSEYSVIGGGFGHYHYNSKFSTTLGGFNNDISVSKYSNIVGGINNYVRSAYMSSIVGGADNKIDSDGQLSLYQFIGGGKDNKLLGNSFQNTSDYSSIVGGQNNVISATTKSTIVGGQNNVITKGLWQSIGGGYGNQITGTNSFTNNIVGGYQNIIRDDAKYSSIVGGSGNIIDGDNVGAGQSGRMFIGGGRDNTLSGSNYSNIVGGYNNTINPSIYSSIIGGESNIVNHNHSHIIGSNITSVSANTTHVERFNIGTIDSGSASTDILVREVNGMISTVPASAITTNDTYVTGGTYNNNSGVATFANNSGITFNISGFTSEVNLGDVLYVSEYGDDSTAVKGNPHKPWADIHTAKSASTSGDTIYVHPQTITFDNTNSAGNPYNGQVDTLVNLWKDGVTYYFSPNTKIILTNETVTGESMYLFSPVATTGETCTVLGHLEYEQFSTGADSSNGANYFYHNNNSGEMGSTFYAEVKKFSSYHCEIIKVIKYNTTPTNVTLISQEEYWDYLGGQTSTGGFYSINASAGAINFKAYCKSRVYTSGIGYGFYFRNDCSNSTIDVFGDKVESTSQIILLRDVIGGTVNIVIGDIHYQNAYTPFGYIGAVLSTTAGTGGCTINLTANLHDLEPTTSTQGVFYLRNTNNTLNFKGSINTKTSGGVGRFISSSTVAGNVININGDITHLGTGTTTEIFFQSAGSGSVTNYTGKISGNFASGIARPTSGGVININNSYIDSIVDGGTSSVFQNSTTAIGTGRLNNSYVRLTNNTNGVVDGEDNNIFINNSTVINLGTGSTVAYNTTNNGDLQVVNSTLISSYSGSTSIEYTGSTTVISSNTTVNTNYNITDLKGNITTLTELIY